jgi:probable H4MPT-linked C1 transfer pathway protein
MATASLLARHCSDCLLVDIGSTTTDVIPIADGLVVARGRDDPSRLIHGELLYTGALRTNVCAIVQRVPLWGYWCPVSAELFATAQDVYSLLGFLESEACTSPTADGRPATPTFAAERLARVVCADAEMLSEDEIQAIAQHVAAEQIRQIGGAISQVRARNDVHGPLIASGVGAFLVRIAADQLGHPCHPLMEVLDLGELSVPEKNATVAAPALAVAILLSDEVSKS